VVGEVEAPDEEELHEEKACGEGEKPHGEEKPVSEGVVQSQAHPH
jgi:hypothetical protein